MSFPRYQSGGAKPPLDRTTVILVAIAGVVVYALWDRGVFNRQTLLFFAVLIPSIVLHEVSHGWVAKRFGDRTAELAGRLTLNPIRHVDPFGTILLPAFLVISSSLAGATPIAFGYAKPVPVNTTFMSANKTMLVGLAGPFINIILAVGVALALNVLQPTERTLTVDLLFYLGLANVILAAFNLIPIPPLDGASVIERFLPRKYWPGYLKFRRWSILVLLAIMLLASEILNEVVFGPALGLWEKLLP